PGTDPPHPQNAHRLTVAQNAKVPQPDWRQCGRACYGPRRPTLLRSRHPTAEVAVEPAAVPDFQQMRGAGGQRSDGALLGRAWRREEDAPSRLPRAGQVARIPEHLGRVRIRRADAEDASPGVEEGRTPARVQLE